MSEDILGLLRGVPSGILTVRLNAQLLDLIFKLNTIFWILYWCIWLLCTCWRYMHRIPLFSALGNVCFKA